MELYIIFYINIQNQYGNMIVCIELKEIEYI